MAHSNFVAKLNYLCVDIKRIEEFLMFSIEIYKDPWCADGELHFPNWCDGRYNGIKWLLPIATDLIKTFRQRQKKHFFVLECLRGAIVAENLIDLFVWDRPRGF